ncbi:MAG: hypothetical protein JXP73_08025, partial [Deltaproteobacteria bacterium]|nr:hypothetical protein [Deltaproteobacteria bacterium]
ERGCNEESTVHDSNHHSTRRKGPLSGLWFGNSPSRQARPRRPDHASPAVERPRRDREPKSAATFAP